MRIISGIYKGRRIELLKEASEHVRPTSDFARQAIFNILDHGRFQGVSHPYKDKDVLDLFCGTGALGLEALSRGAAHATFVDKSRDALANTRYNASRIQAMGQVETLQADASRLPQARRPFGLVFMDPPYFAGLLSPALSSLKAGGWLAEKALIVIEHDARDRSELPEGFAVLDTRRYGRAVIEILQFSQP